ncbi:hypothetical protein OMK64_01740 [Cellulomonas fimi]|uniref:hypothetical protein n=1 Tax=Cellulomonas fimi TaxID=1708 RepID=UPI00234D0123|nr:hypothetical protein [Cellulomonas fimi]MDC7120254.1 hypothetical protein [Cellulomonas fimi]
MPTVSITPVAQERLAGPGQRQYLVADPEHRVVAVTARKKSDQAPGWSIACPPLTADQAERVVRRLCSVASLRVQATQLVDDGKTAAAQSMRHEANKRLSNIAATCARS